MTDNEIIKALGYCLDAVDEGDTKTFDFLSAVIDLINRQKAEIEKLEAEIAEANSIERENELQALQENRENAKLFLQAIQHAKSEAIKEFAERLKGKYENSRQGRYMDWLMNDIIGNLVKEMAEVKENE